MADEPDTILDELTPAEKQNGAGGSTPDLRSVDFRRELGVSGLKHRFGRIQEEWLDQLKGKDRAEVVQQMLRNDALIGGVDKAIRNLLLTPDWHVDPADPNHRREVEKAEFIDSNLRDMSHGWKATLEEILSFLPHGWSWVEIVLKRRRGDHRRPGLRSRFDDGRLGIRKLALRAQDTLERWVFDSEGGVQALVQRDPNTFDEHTIPIQKSLLFRTRIHAGSPAGLSILRSAFKGWMIKKEIEEIEAIGVERDIVGVPKFTAPMEWFDKDERTSSQATALGVLEDAAKNLRIDEQMAIGIPKVPDGDGGSLIDFELLNTPGQKMFDTSRIITRWDMRIAMSMLADFVLLGQTGVGSFALAESKTEMFKMALEAHLDSVAEVMNRHLVPRLLRLNGMDTDRLPELRHDEVSVPDLKELGLFLQRLGRTGALDVDEQLKDRLRELAGLPETQSDAEPAAEG